MQFMFVGAAAGIEAVASLWVKCASRRRLRPHSQFSQGRHRRQLGSTGADSGNHRRPPYCLARLRAGSQDGVFRVRLSSNPVFTAGLSAALVRTGPASTQRLRCWRSGGGVGAEYAPTPFLLCARPSLSTKPLQRTLARLRGQERQVGQGSCPNMAPTPSALPNPSLKRSANGRPPGPATGYGVHFPVAGPGVLPSSPA